MIVVECDADEAVVRLCGFPRSRIRHEGGKGKVINHVLKAAEVAVGVVDEDPGSIPPETMGRFAVETSTDSLVLRRLQGSRGKRLVVIRPRLEEWLLARAASAGIRPAEFGLPKDPHALHASGHYERRSRFPEFMGAVLAADSEMKRLQTWLSEASE